MALNSALRGTPWIASQLGQLVGTPYSARLLDIEHVADQMIWRVGRVVGLHFDEPTFSSLLEEYLADLERTSFRFVVLMPLVGLEMEAAHLQLAPGLEICRMTDPEIARCLQIGLFPNPMGSQRMRHSTPEYALRFRDEVRKCVGNQSDEDIHEFTMAEEQVRGRCLAVLRALRLFKSGSLSAPGILRYSEDWWANSGLHFGFEHPGMMPWFNKYDLRAPEETAFAAFWTVCESVGRGPLGNAIRRFSDAMERGRPQDAVVDLMIAAESLFLSDAGDAQQRGELRYRLALRAAFFIDSTEYSRREVFRHMKRAYDARSAIVHGGGEPDGNLLKSPKDVSCSLSDFRDTTATLIRAGLHKAVGLATPQGRLSVNWDDLVIPP